MKDAPKEAAEKVIKDALAPAWDLLLVLREQEDDLPPDLKMYVERFHNLGTDGDALEDTFVAATMMLCSVQKELGYGHPTLGRKIKDACAANSDCRAALERLAFHEQLNQGWPPEDGGAV